MNETGPHVEAEPLSVSGRRTSTKARWALLVTVIAVGGLVAAALIWRPWVKDEAGGAACVEDATQVLDEESGACFTIPDDWEIGAPERASGLESDNSMAYAPRMQASVTVWGVNNAEAQVEPEDAARKVVSDWTGLGSDSATIESVGGAVDGHASAVATGASDLLWIMVTAVEDGDSLVLMLGTVVSSDPGLIDQVRTIQSSIRLE